MNKTTVAAVSLALSLSALACSGASPEPTSPGTPEPVMRGTTEGVAPVVMTTSTASAPASTEIPAPAAPSVTATAPAAPGPGGSAAPASDRMAPVLHLTQGKVTTAEADLAAADTKVRQCLAKSKGAGEVLVKITISTSGNALSATATPTGDVSKDAVKCARDAMRDHLFGKPVGGGVAAAEGTFKVSGS